MPRPLAFQSRVIRLTGVATALAVLAFGGIAPPPAVEAATPTFFSVNSLSDAPGALPLNDGVCATGYNHGVPNGVCTLRAAVDEANGLTGGGAVIDFHGLQGSQAVTIWLGALDLESSMTIVGGGPEVTSVSVDQAQTTGQRVFYIGGGANVTISGISVSNGLVSGSSAYGGGIYNDGSLTLIDSNVFDNSVSASGGYARGGGIFSDGTLHVENSSISSNHSNEVGGTSVGGGIFADVVSTSINDSVISNNTADYGGGMYADGEIDGSTVSGNQAAGDGGGIITDGIDITNSTITSNSANGNGGGLYISYGPSDMFNVTLSSNTANADASGTGNGGGIYTQSGGVTMLDTILANNVYRYSVGKILFINPSNCYQFAPGDIDSNGNVIVSDDTGCGIYGPYSVGDPVLGNLQNNGGPTDTQALTAGSIAIDHGRPSGCIDLNSQKIKVDQRGAKRPVDGDANGTAVCDVGAFEYLSSPLIQESDRHIQYGGWRGVMDPTASNATYRASGDAGESATFRFTGPTVKWLTRKGPEMGEAQVLIDGVSKGTFNLKAANTAPITETFGGLSSASHTLVVKVLHQTTGFGYDVVVDGFVAGTTTVDDSSCKIQYDSWKCISTTNANGGTWRSSSSASAAAVLHFDGSSINLLTAAGTSYGKAAVCIDSTCHTINLGTGSRIRNFSGLGAGPHLLVLQPLHQKASTSSGYAIVLDGFSGPVRVTSDFPTP